MASIASPSAATAPHLGDLKTRLRAPLLALVAVISAIDFIGLGLHLADAKNDAATSEPAPRAQARTTITAPNAVVDSADVAAASGANASRTATPSGVLIGPVAPPVVTTPSGNSGTPSPTPTPTPAPGATPVLQTGVGVPALGVNASVGLGEGSCTTVDLTLIALGDCPAPAGDGAVILQLGGSLLGD